MSTEGKIAYIAVTKNGKELAQRLKQLMGQGDIYITSKLAQKYPSYQRDESYLGYQGYPGNPRNTRNSGYQGDSSYPGYQVNSRYARNTRYLGDESQVEGSDQGQEGHLEASSELSNEAVYLIEGKLGDFMEQLFVRYDYLICIMATGIVVRVIAPYVVSKFKDPAVIVLDERGENVISLLSGHMGGANEMTRKMSRLLKAHPVITTATDVNEKAALDCIAKSLDAYIEDFREQVKTVNYGLVNGEKIGLYIRGDYKVDERGFVRLDTLEQEVLMRKLSEMDRVIYISHEAETCISHPHLIKVVPRRFVLGVGCKKYTQRAHMLEHFNRYMEKHGLDRHSISKIGSIILKKDEDAIIGLGESLEVPFEVFTKEEIAKVEALFEGSSFVKQSVGVTCVAEPVAYLLGSGEIILPKEKYEGITFALGVAR